METRFTISRRGFLGACAAITSALVIWRDAAAEEQIYGSQMMTEQEKLAYRERMRRATSDQQRAQVRAEHHEQMQERARAQGRTLPDQPPVGGRGPGSGMGRGMPVQPGMGGGRGGGPGKP